MIRTTLALLAAAAPAAIAQITPGTQTPPPGTVMVGHPIQQRPPTLPLRTPVRPAQPPVTTRRPPNNERPRNVIYVPAALPYNYLGPAQPQNPVNVSVTNVIETPPAQIYYAAPAYPVYNGLQVWDADADLAAERAARAAAAVAEPERMIASRAAEVDDVKSMDAIIGAYYDALSGPRGTPRNWLRFASLFADGARLTATRVDLSGPPRATAMSVDEYAHAATPVLERGVFAKEVSRNVEKFGAITHVFSTYERRRTTGDEKPYQRGINSIQLMNDGTRWWITGITWDEERADTPIPAKYLPASAAKR